MFMYSLVHDMFKASVVVTGSVLSIKTNCLPAPYNSPLCVCVVRSVHVVCQVLLLAEFGEICALVS